MPVSPRLTLAKPRIVAYFDDHAQSVFTAAEIATILQQNREEWRLAQRLSAAKFTEYLVTRSKLRRVEFTSEHYRPIHRFVWGEATPFQLALALKPDSYLTHGTAVFLHGLTDLIPHTFYANKEQSPKPGSDELTQANLDRAFARPQRVSRYKYVLGEDSFVILSGKHTGKLGVETVSGPSGEPLACTSLERTLIDIAVRPAYAGGIYQVAEAYTSARDDVSVNALVALLRKLDYLYPYHQAIGFLLERAGVSEQRLARLRELGLEYDFYLTHAMSETDYSSTWRLHYPRSF
jgi:hypothetical protein